MEAGHPTMAGLFRWIALAVADIAIAAVTDGIKTKSGAVANYDGCHARGARILIERISGVNENSLVRCG